MTSAGGKFHVLLVEDNPADVVLFREYLEPCRDQYTINQAVTVQEAVREAHVSKPDILILDLTVPDSTGLETLKLAGEQIQDVPIVVLTGLADEALGLQAVQMGAEDYLVKNRLDEFMLPRVIRYAIERYHNKQNMANVTRDLLRLNQQLSEANENLERLSVTDPLTGLMNRRGLQDQLSREVIRAGRQHHELSAILVDLDDFKEVNDMLGHAVGDVVLKEIAKRLHRSVRQTDIIARIGGDEFMMLLPATRIAEAMQVAEKLRSSLADSFIAIGDRNLRITCSLAVIEVTDRMPTIDDLLRYSHEILSRSKMLGKNRASTKNDIQHSGSIKEVLNQKDSYRVVRQEIIHLATEKVSGYEMLSRSCIPGLEMPLDFFHFAMESRMLTCVDHLCLQLCIGEILKIHTPGLRYHVNLFPSTLINLSPHQVLEQLGGVRDEVLICLEISEQQIIGDPAYLMPAVAALKSSGFQIGIDDVGYGRSCLESILMLEPEVLKIDRKMMAGLGTDPVKRKTLERLLRMVRNLPMQVIAEGIENNEDRKVVQELGITHAQGFLWGQPHE